MEDYEPRQASNQRHRPIEDTQTKSDVVLDSDPLIQEGLYNATYRKHATTIMGGKGKLVIVFEITDGEHAGVQLKAYYPVIAMGKPGPYGKFTAKRIGKYYEEMCEIFPDLVAGRMDRISPRRLRGNTIVVEVGTVREKWNGEERKPHVQYSVVRKMISLQSEIN